MNSIAKALNLPTYPIADSMHVGRRKLDELQWLIDRGYYSHWYNKRLIIKQHGRYQLLRNNAPAPELEAEASTLDGLIKLFDIPIYMYQWHINWIEEDNEATPEASHTDKLEDDALEAMKRQQEAESA